MKNYLNINETMLYNASQRKIQISLLDFLKKELKLFLYICLGLFIICTLFFLLLKGNIGVFLLGSAIILFIFILVFLVKLIKGLFLGFYETKNDLETEDSAFLRKIFTWISNLV
ncbi:MAG: hypothetical protein IJ211_01795 [Campylobacter sp.]|nr:hypothetical protein [Campylobacter sp.]